MRNIVPKAKFFWHPKKFTRNVATPREIFLRGFEIFLRRVGHVVTCHVPLAVAVPQITI